MMAETSHRLILDVIKDRFGIVPRDVTKHLGEIVDEKKLRQLNLLAGKCPDLAAFHEAVLSCKPASASTIRRGVVHRRGGRWSSQRCPSRGADHDLQRDPS